MKSEPITNYVITEHAALELRRRGLKEETVRAILSAPEERLEIRPGRVILQSRINMGAPEKAYLVRVFVDVDRQPAEVITVYRTSEIYKYWGGSE